MHNVLAPRLSKWPFLLSAGLLLSLAILIFAQSKWPLGKWELVTCTACVVLGAGCGVFPFVLELRVRTRLVVCDQLADAGDEIAKLTQVAAQIAGATAAWQNVHDSANTTARTAREISDRMAAEVRDFNAFLQRANEGERNMLRLEVEKLHRRETEFLQVLTHTLDHVFALHRAALRNGQPAIIEQIGLFQNACRDAARRVGFVPVVPAPAEPFDARRHQLSDENADAPAGSLVEETLAAGYTFQGQLLRPALVRLRNGQ